MTVAQIVTRGIGPGGSIAGIITAGLLSGADVTAPTVINRVIGITGNSITLTLSEIVTFGAGGNGGFTVSLSGGAATLTYSSGSGTNALIYTTSRTIGINETGTISYTQPGNGVEDLAGNDLATFSNAVLFNSRLGGGGKMKRPIKSAIKRFVKRSVKA